MRYLFSVIDDGIGLVTAEEGGGALAFPILSGRGNGHDVHTYHGLA
jgi:hypothetical protein